MSCTFKRNNCLLSSNICAKPTMADDASTASSPSVASGSVGGGVDSKAAKATAKLEAALNAGDFYGALQVYRTIIKR